VKHFALCLGIDRVVFVPCWLVDVPVGSTIDLMKRSYDTSRIDFWAFDVPMMLIPKCLLAVPYRLYRLVKYRGASPSI
jgi:hypothetical protein